MKKPGHIHFASAKSPRLKRVLSVLKMGTATTRDIIRRARVCAVSSIISELRENGFDITCKMKSRGVFEYKLNRGAAGHE